MNEKKIQIKFTTVVLILVAILILVMAFFIYKLNNERIITLEKNKALNNETKNLQNTVNQLQEKIEIISNTINSKTISDTTSTEHNISVAPSSQTPKDNVSNEKSQSQITVESQNNNSSNNNISYSFNKETEAIITINATKNGKIISKKIEMSTQIDKTGTMDIKNIGTVALISESGGEYCKVHIYQLINEKIELLGDIDCGADMEKNATYTTSVKNDGIAVINAKANNESLTKEIEMSAAIENISIVDIFDYGKVILVAESGGEYYGIQVFRLSQDHSTGKIKEIKNVGFIKNKI